MASTIQLRLGTRGSMLARTQSQQVADALMAMHPQLQVTLVEIRTTGDQVQNKPLHDIGGKGLFTREVELALLDGQVDFAVHSMKDMPVTQPLVPTESLVIASVPARQSVEDVLFSPAGYSPESLPAQARLATGSLRRIAQWKAARTDVAVCPIRGNIDTRLRKVREGEFDAVVLASAGLRRAGLFDPATMKLLPVEQFVPAAGQGALAIQCRAADGFTRDLLSGLHDPQTALCVQLERSIVQELHGDCQSPIGALAWVSPPVGEIAPANPSGQISMIVAVAAQGGHLPIIQARATWPIDQWTHLLNDVTRQLMDQQALKLLHGPDGAPG